MELSELKDKLRWRKQSEEPAPTGAKVLIRYLDYDEIKMRIACIEDMCDPDGEPCYADICWRPLDLPEEEKQRWMGNGYTTTTKAAFGTNAMKSMTRVKKQ